jgi:hypothetical protein
MGLGSYVGFAEKALFTSTAAAADVKTWYRVTEGYDSLQFDRKRVEINELSNYDPITAVLYGGVTEVTGSITIPTTYNKLQNLLRFLTGHNVTVSGAGPFVYAFVPVAPNVSTHYQLGSADKNLAVELYKNQGTNSVFYQGCVINEWSMRFENNSVVETTIGFMGRNFSISAKSTPTYATGHIVAPTGQDVTAAATAFLQLTPQGGANTAFICHSATLTITNGFEFRRDLSSIQTLLPFPTAKREVRLECEVELDDETILNRIDNPTTTRFTAGKLFLDDLDTTSQIEIALNELVLDAPVEPRVGGIGVVTASLSMVALSDGTTPSYSVTLTNQDAAYAP